MSSSTQGTSVLERRDENIGQADALWENLTLAQKFSASSLTQFGFELNFIRDYHHSHVAVLTCNDTVASISKVGEIDTDPSIALR